MWLTTLRCDTTIRNANVFIEIAFISCSSTRYRSDSSPIVSNCRSLKRWKLKLINASVCAKNGIRIASTTYLI